MVPYIPVRANIFHMLPDLLRTWLEGDVRAAAAARPARCVLVGMRRRCCMARSNQHLLMAAWPSCTVQNPDAGKKLESSRRPSADRTKQEAKTD